MHEGIAQLVFSAVVLFMEFIADAKPKTFCTIAYEKLGKATIKGNNKNSKNLK